MSTNKMLIECENGPFSDELQQGDVVKFSKYDDLWNQYGIIITADCDIDKGKHKNVFSFCPFIDLDHYLFKFFLSNLISTERVIVLIKKEIDKSLKINIDVKNIPNWLAAQGVDGALKDLSLPNKNLKLISLLNLLNKVYTENISIDLYLEYANIVLAKSDKEKEEKSIKDCFKNHICSLPGDLFYFNYLQCNDKIGYIVNLRRIGMLDKTQICTNVSNYEKEKHLVMRIARMSSPFRYSLTQKVAQMFSDIGLPNEYEEDRKNAVELLLLNLRRRV